MTITLTVAGRIATVEADGHVVAGNTYPVTVALDSEWTGSLYLRVRFGSLYYDIPFASSAASVDVQMPVGYPEVGIGVFSEALQTCTSEARIRLLRSILEAGEQVVEFDSDLYDQWAGEVTTLLTDDAFDAESTRPVQNAVLTAWKDTVPLDANLVHKTGDETIAGNKVLQGVLSLSRPSEPILNLKSGLTYSAEAFRSEVTTTDIKDGVETKLTQVISRVQPTSSQYDVRVYKPDRSGFYDMDLRSYSDHFAILVPTYYPVDGSSNPQPLTANALVTSGNIAVDPRLVHTTGTETIAGDKTFTGNTTVQKSDEVALIVRDTRNYGTTQVKGGVQIYCKNSNGNDANMGSVSLFQSVSAGIQRSQMQLVARNTAGQSASILVSQYEDGHADTESPSYTPVDSGGNHLTPSARSIINSSMLAVDPRVVHTTGNETISGAKTFNNRCYFKGAPVVQSSQTWCDVMIASKGFSNFIESRRYNDDYTLFDEHFAVGNHFSNANGTWVKLAGYGPRTNLGDTSESQTAIRLVINTNNNDTGSLSIVYTKRDGTEVTKTITSFSNGEWS